MAKPGRCITLTPLPSQPPFLSPHFPSLSPSNSSGNITSSWKSNPAFTNHSTAFESALPLSPKREGCLKKRDREDGRNMAAEPHHLRRETLVLVNLLFQYIAAMRNATARDKSSMSARRGQQVKGQSTNGHHGGRECGSEWYRFKN